LWRVKVYFGFRRFVVMRGWVKVVGVAEALTEEEDGGVINECGSL
jgi:hypothetical protein